MCMCQQERRTWNAQTVAKAENVCCYILSFILPQLFVTKMIRNDSVPCNPHHGQGLRGAMLMPCYCSLIHEAGKCPLHTAHQTSTTLSLLIESLPLFALQHTPLPSSCPIAVIGLQRSRSRCYALVFAARNNCLPGASSVSHQIWVRRHLRLVGCCQIGFHQPLCPHELFATHSLPANAT
jgi:hypothetical protein